MKVIWNGDNMSRHLHEIAQDISQHWPKMYFGAVPYVKAMFELESINDMYYQDSAEEIVLRFLVNAGTWRGEKAREIKSELRTLLKEVR